MKHGIKLGIAVAALALLAPGGAVRADDALIAAGRAIAANGVAPDRPGCAACHMLNGAGQPDVGIPRLAGLTTQQIVAQLTYFAEGTRHDPAMSAASARLTPAQRQQAAAYFAALPLPPHTDPLPSPAALRARGEALFHNGDQRTGLIACALCHGATGLGVGEFSPRLAGQSAAYVAAQLDAWHAGALRDPQGAFMRAEARTLTPPDIAALAAYVAALGDKEPQTP
jgi:cytochrome c553